MFFSENLTGYLSINWINNFLVNGVQLEALECLSSSASAAGVLDSRPNSRDSEVLPTILRPSPDNSSRWLSDKVACHLAYHVKLDTAMQYTVNLIREHLCWSNTSLVLAKAGATGMSSLEYEISQYGALLEKSKQHLDSELAYLQMKFSVVQDELLDKVSLHSICFNC